MSLFKALTFWSFDLGHLAAGLNTGRDTASGQEQGSDTRDPSSVSPSLDSNSATFIASPGRFHSVGPHDVLVCSSLSGLICIVQIPKSQQLKQTNDGKDLAAKSSSKKTKKSSIESVEEAESRQLLCAKDLKMPVVDLKCGYFTSALKQSIAVISFNKLLVYAVKRRQIDLLSSDTSGFANGGLILNENLFSHDIKEHHRLDLYPNEIAFNIVVIDRQQHSGSHAGGSKRSLSSRGQSDERDSASSKSAQQVHLPQRDNIIVQYTNQYLITIIDHKKIAGHFRLTDDNSPTLTKASSTSPDDHLQQLSQFVGLMPIAYLGEARYPSLVITLSDQRLYCVPLAKFVALAKQSVVRRVAKNLMLEGGDCGFGGSSNEISSATDLIDVDLDSAASWKLELVCAPLQIAPVHRQRHRSEELSSSSLSSYSQLLIMSRYNLDLFSSTGAHIWSQRFETPLICMCNYVIEPTPSEGKTGSSSNDRLMSLVCVDCLNNDRSDLLILEEDRTVWSAQLNNKPAQLWRTNLQQMTATLTTLSINDNLLSTCYLGTNSEHSASSDATDELENMDPSDQVEENDLVKLEHIDEPLFVEEQLASGSRRDEAASPDETRLQQKRKLLVQVRLEASEQWPNVSVESVISMRPELGRVSTALQNIKVVMEFDDLFKFDQTSAYPLSVINEGALEVHLGSCWPDRREPVRLAGRFSIRAATSAEAAEALGDKINWMPKSLKVDLQFRFLESRSSVWIQRESFLLPLNMIARLTHIDYSTGQNQSLEDIQSNLGMYKRSRSGSYDRALQDDQDEQVAERARPPYFLCDFMIRTQCELIDLIDELIESDLICRGLNSESPDYRRELQRTDSRKLITLENISLLAQSLDCRLKYKSLARDKSLVEGTSVDDVDRQTVMISIALKIPTLSELMGGLKEDEDAARFDIVWLHLCDLAVAESRLPEEMTRQHMKEWKVYNVGPGEPSGQPENEPGCPILVSIECEYPVPVLFLLRHLIERLKHRSNNPDELLSLQPMSEQIIDSIDISFESLHRVANFIAIDAHLHDRLRLAIDKYQDDLKQRFSVLRKNLDDEYRKFHLATMRSLSLSKRLFNLPPSMQQQFHNLSLLIKQYQLNLNSILSELESLQRLESLYGKMPSVSEILIENQSGQAQRCPSLTLFAD